ncbi:hypothetical protein, partial [Actinopolymorpha rutila]
TRSKAIKKLVWGIVLAGVGAWTAFQYGPADPMDGTATQLLVGAIGALVAIQGTRMAGREVRRLYEPEVVADLEAEEAARKREMERQMGGTDAGHTQGRPEVATTGQWWETLPFTPRDHDVRIYRGEWIFYVRAVKVGEPLVNGVGADNPAILTPIMNALFWNRVKGWKVGVLRYRNHWWKAGRIRIVYKERLAPSQAPDQRIAELVRAVNDGSFDK